MNKRVWQTMAAIALASLALQHAQAVPGVTQVAARLSINPDEGGHRVVML